MLGPWGHPKAAWFARKHSRKLRHEQNACPVGIRSHRGRATDSTKVRQMNVCGREVLRLYLEEDCQFSSAVRPTEGQSYHRTLYEPNSYMSLHHYTLHHRYPSIPKMLVTIAVSPLAQSTQRRANSCAPPRCPGNACASAQRTAKSASSHSSWPTPKTPQTPAAAGSHASTACHRATPGCSAAGVQGSRPPRS